MKRVLSVIAFLILMFPLFSSSDNSQYFDLTYLWIVDSNVTSYPLPVNVSSSWLSERVDNPFLTNYSNGFAFSWSTFFSSEARTGLTLGLTWALPYFSKSTKPVGSFSETDGSWAYESYNSLPEQFARLFFSIGPVFRAKIKSFDFGIHLRLAIGTYNYFKEAFILGLEASPYMNWFINDSFYIKGGLEYQGNFIRLFLDNPNKIYDEHYLMTSLGAYIGFGYSYGNKRK